MSEQDYFNSQSRLRDDYLHRLWDLQEKEAIYGITTAPEILDEIETITHHVQSINDAIGEPSPTNEEFERLQKILDRHQRRLDHRLRQLPLLRQENYPDTDIKVVEDEIPVLQAKVSELQNRIANYWS